MWPGFTDTKMHANPSLNSPSFPPLIAPSLAPSVSPYSRTMLRQGIVDIQVLCGAQPIHLCHDHSIA